jgi:hypothetical protein
MGNGSIVTLSRSIARPWAPMRNFHQYIIRSPMEQLKGQMAWYFRESRSAYSIKRRVNG